MRKYEPLWQAIKDKGKVSIAADPSIHPRIINAIRKEKARDLSWKYLLQEKNKRYNLYEDIDGSLLTFRLVSKPLLKINYL